VTPATSPTRVVLSGYYGFNNLGDELILRVLLNALQTGNCRPTVLSLQPEATLSLHSQTGPFVKAVNRWQPFHVLRALWHSDSLVSGGGGLFQDSTGLGSALYYGGIILAAKLLGKKVGLVFQGLGPLRHPVSRWITGRALRAVDTVWLRDPDSIDLGETLAPGVQAVLVPDSVWGLTLSSPPPTEHPPVTVRGNYQLGISLRAWPSLTPAALTGLATTLADHIQERLAQTPGEQVTLHLLPFQADEDDATLLAMAAALDKALNLAARPVTIQTATPGGVLDVFPHLDACLCMRFHALVLALKHRTPVHVIDYAPKVTSLAKHLGLGGVITSPERLEVKREGMPLFAPLSPEGEERLQTLEAEAQVWLTRLPAVLGKS
jgi:polysaccharide pyruvyl transferase CsaB